MTGNLFRSDIIYFKIIFNSWKCLLKVFFYHNITSKHIFHQRSASHTYTRCCHECDLFLSFNSQKTVCVSQSDCEKRRVEDECDSDESECVFWSDTHTQICVWILICSFWVNTQYVHGPVCLIDCVLHRGNVCLNRRYLKAAGSPKVSTLHPWPASTDARLQSVHSTGTEERTTDMLLLLLFWYVILFQHVPNPSLSPALWAHYCQADWHAQRSTIRLRITFTA